MKKTILTYLPLAMILIGIIALYLSGIYNLLTFDYIKEKYTILLNYTHQHPFLSAFYFLSIYIVSVCLIIPDSILLSLIAGFLFPLPLAIFYIVLSETLGAMLFFLAVREAFIQVHLKPKFPQSNYLEKKFNTAPAPFLLFFRFSHLLPFWIINFAAVCLRVKKSTFFWTTLIGVIPLAVLLAQEGMGLSHYFNTHVTFSIDDLFNTQMKITLIGLGIIALIPVCIKTFRKR